MMNIRRRPPMTILDFFIVNVTIPSIQSDLIATASGCSLPP